jgi:GTP cyclohydrolase II
MNNINLAVKIERAISELRRGGKIIISDINSGMSVILTAAEMIEIYTVTSLSQITSSRPNLILSSNRSNTLGLTSNNYPCSILIEKTWTINDILSLCMPIHNHSQPNLNGVVFEKSNNVVSSCLLLLRQARLLPAGIMSIISNVPIEKVNDWASKNNIIYIDSINVTSFEKNNAERLSIAVRAQVPLAATKNCEVVIFRPKDGGNEHFCLLIGKSRYSSNNQENVDIPMVRIHSQCITGDILDSLKCDCGQQLKDSIKLMAQADEGILIYLAQEGRDIGLLNKLRAYALQEKGMDTVEANLALGFKDDERLYYPVKEILKQLNVNSIKLITNNPKKIDHLTNLGVKVVERIPIKIKANKYNKKYLKTKSKKSGHIL